MVLPLLGRLYKKSGFIASTSDGLLFIFIFWGWYDVNYVMHVKYWAHLLQSDQIESILLPWNHYGLMGWGKQNKRCQEKRVWKIRMVQGKSLVHHFHPNNPIWLQDPRSSPDLCEWVCKWCDSWNGIHKIARTMILVPGAFWFIHNTSDLIFFAGGHFTFKNNNIGLKFNYHVSYIPRCIQVSCFRRIQGDWCDA